MLKFISFASGSSGNCYYLFTEHGGIFIDVGIGVRQIKKYFDQYGLKLSEAKAILVTHDHADHVKSVGSLSHDLHLPVYSTAKVHQGIDSNYIVHHKVETGSRRMVLPGESFFIDEFIITPVSVPHDSNDNVGYRIQVGDVVFVIITDAGHVTEEMSKFITEANYLVIESNHEVEMLMKGKYPDFLKQRVASPNGHLSNADCGKALCDYASPNLRHVWLCHLSNDNNTPDLARYTVEACLRNVGIIPGKDFLLDVLKRKSPCEVTDLV